MSRTKAWIFGVILVAILCVGAILLDHWISPEVFSKIFDRSHPQTKEEANIRVQRVIDGDTIELENGQKVRYIGINTPETVDPRRKVECFGKEASAFNHNLVEGKFVRLVKDISETDKYGRLLRFVYLEDGTLVNEVLVREGYAYASVYPPDISKKDLFSEAESAARIEKQGLWSPDTCDGKK